MEDRIFIADYLHTYFDEVEPKDFYREINAPRYMIKHGSITTIEKRTEYKERYKITKLFWTLNDYRKDSIQRSECE